MYISHRWSLFVWNLIIIVSTRVAITIVSWKTAKSLLYTVAKVGGLFKENLHSLFGWNKRLRAVRVSRFAGRHTERHHRGALPRRREVEFFQHVC
jgi:hypothetical protein